MAEASVRFVPAKFPEPVNIQPGSYIQIKLDDGDQSAEPSSASTSDSGASQSEFWDINENSRDRGSRKNSRICKSWEAGARAPLGLVNRGVTCYMNSAIQCLIHVPAVARYLGDVLKNKYKETIRRDSVTYELAMLYKKLLEAKKREIYPAGMIKNLENVNCMMSEWKQEDAHEYYMSLMGRLQEDSVPRGEKLNSSIFYDIFGGTIKQHVICAKCKSVSTTDQDFYDLCVGITEDKDIQSSIKEYFRHELLKLKGQEGYFCEKCKLKTKAYKTSAILRAPEYLNIQLKRFKFDGESGRKLQTQVSYPMDLDLSEYSSSEPKEDLKYQLVAVIEHSGRNLSSGHYIALCRQPNNGWASYDDDVVQKVSERVVKRNGNAYMLIYSRLTKRPEQPAAKPQQTQQLQQLEQPESPSLKRKPQRESQPQPKSKYTKLEASKKASSEIDDLFKKK